MVKAYHTLKRKQVVEKKISSNAKEGTIIFWLVADEYKLEVSKPKRRAMCYFGRTFRRGYDDQGFSTGQKDLRIVV